METRLHIAPQGSKFDVDRGGKRKYQLHVSRGVWNKILSHVDRKRFQQEADEAIQRRKAYMKDTSKAMTRDWANSVENMRHRDKVERLKRLEAIEINREKEHLIMLQSRAEVRKQCNDIAQQKIFHRSSDAISLNNALKMSDVIHEREKQLEMKESNRQYLEKEKQKNDQAILNEDMRVRKENIEEVENRIRKAMLNSNYLKMQMAEKEEKRKREREICIQEASVDYIKRLKEMEVIENNLQKDRIENKRDTLAILDNKRKYVMKERKNIAKEEEEIGKVMKYFNDTKVKIGCIRKDMRKKKMDEVVEKQRIHGEKLMVIIKEAQRKNEDEMIAAQAKEKDDEAEEKRIQQEAHEQRLREQRKGWMKKNEDKNKWREGRAEDMRRWQIANRLKTDEVVKAVDIVKAKEVADYELGYKEQLSEQIEDNKKRRADLKAHEDTSVWNTFPEEDRKFLEYGQEILDGAKTKYRNTYPIENAILQYKKKYMLIPPWQTDPNRCEKLQKRK